MHVVRVGQTAGHPAGGIVVAGYDKDDNAGRFQALDLGDKIKTGMVVFPVAVKQIARNQDNVDGLRHRQIDEIFERPSGGLANFGHGRSLVSFQTMQRAVQVDVGGMDELEHSADDPLCCGKRPKMTCRWVKNKWGGTKHPFGRQGGTC